MGITTAANSLFLLVCRCIVCAHARKTNVEFFSTLCEQHKVRQHCKIAVLGVIDLFALPFALIATSRLTHA